MGRYYVLLVSVLCCSLTRLGQAHDGAERLPVLPAAQADDVILVHWNLAPMMPDKWGELLTYAGLYHASVSFFNERTRLSSFAQFVAPSFGSPILFPHLSPEFQRDCKDPSLWKASLSWNNTGHVMFVDESHTGYHWKHRTLVATINGSIYNSVRSWVLGAMDVYTEYYLFHALTDEFQEYKSKAARSGHGGIPINDKRAPSGMDAKSCQARCTNDLRCDCASLDSDGKCFKRAWCNHSSFADDGNVTTWVKKEVSTGFKALTCMDFARLVLTQIYNLAGPCAFDPHSEGILVDDPVLHLRGELSVLDPTLDPHALEVFCRYFTRMDVVRKGIAGGVAAKLQGFAALLEELVLDRAVFHRGANYLSYRPVFPFISYRKRFVPLPGSGECAAISEADHQDSFGGQVILV